jgi:hypothetical protein
MFRNTLLSVLSHSFIKAFHESSKWNASTQNKTVCRRGEAELPPNGIASEAD